MELPENQYASVTALAACATSGAVAMALYDGDLLHHVRFTGGKLADHNGAGSGTLGKNGMYITLSPEGKTKRYLHADYTKIPLEDATIAEELIGLTEQLYLLHWACLWENAPSPVR